MGQELSHLNQLKPSSVQTTPPIVSTTELENRNSRWALRISKKGPPNQILVQANWNNCSLFTEKISFWLPSRKIWGFWGLKKVFRCVKNPSKLKYFPKKRIRGLFESKGEGNLQVGRLCPNVWFHKLIQLWGHSVLDVYDNKPFAQIVLLLSCWNDEKGQFGLKALK